MAEAILECLTVLRPRLYFVYEALKPDEPFAVPVRGVYDRPP